MRPPLATLAAAITTACLALTTPATAHVPAHCTVDRIQPVTTEKIRAMNELAAAAGREDLLRVLRGTKHLIEVDGRMMVALTEWITCVAGN